MGKLLLQKPLSIILQEVAYYDENFWNSQVNQRFWLSLYYVLRVTHMIKCKYILNIQGFINYKYILHKYYTKFVFSLIAFFLKKVSIKEQTAIEYKHSSTLIAKSGQYGRLKSNIDTDIPSFLLSLVNLYLRGSCCSG